MNRLILLLTSYLLPLTLSAQIHADIKPYHDRFINEAKARGIATMPVVAPTKMQFFTKTGTNIHGGVFYPEKAIYFSQSYWATATDTDRELIVFHELAHYYFNAGHIRHHADIMNPNQSPVDYTANRAQCLDILFRKVYETPIDRTDITMHAGDIIITSDDAESETFRMYTLDDSTPATVARSLAIFDSIKSTHNQYDYINAKGWRFKPAQYSGVNPVLQYDGRVAQVWGEMNRMYMFAENPSRAPKLGANARIRWPEGAEMTLVIDYKTTTVPVRRNATIMYFVKTLPSLAAGKQQINVP